MPRPKSVTPTEELSIMLPRPLIDRVRILLWSDLHGKIPYGALQGFFSQLLREYFDQASLQHNGHTYRGTTEAINALKEQLNVHT